MRQRKAHAAWSGRSPAPGHSVACSALVPREHKSNLGLSLWQKNKMRQVGFEPTTFGFEVRDSIR